MNILLWLLQGLLALMFLWHGWLFTSPPAELAESINTTVGPRFRIFMGVAELLAALGLVLPGVTRIAPWLIPLAAAGLMIVTASATLFHLFRGEFSTAITTIVLLGLTSFVAVMRWKIKPIVPRVVL